MGNPYYSNLNKCVMVLPLHLQSHRRANTMKMQALSLFESSECLVINAFVGSADTPAGGNNCLLSIFERAHASTVDLSYFIKDEREVKTSCLSWPASDDNKNVRVQCFIVQCYQKKRLIHCCGHGLLAAAHYWITSLDTEAIVLQMHESLVNAYKQDDRIWLRFSRLSAAPSKIPYWLSPLIRNDDVLEAAIAGGDQGYLILVWPDNYAIEDLAPPGEKLKNFTQRALIYTARQTHVSSTVDIHFRYFAPQYGVCEDNATGSAMRVLIDFWAKQFTSMTALQVSSTRGVLYGRVAEGAVEVGGRCCSMTRLQNMEMMDEPS